MGKEESVDGAVEHHHLHARIEFDQFDDLFQLRNGLVTEDIQGRMVERHAPISRRNSLKPDLPGSCWFGHL